MVKISYTQIKYLYNESLKIIHEFGIKYYFNFGLNQLKIQKLNLFLTKENYYNKLENNTILNPREQYAFWKENKKLQNENIMNGDTMNGDTMNGDTMNGDTMNGDTIQYSQKSSKITIMLNPNTSKDIFIKSIKSILDQSYSNWELFIMGRLYSNKEIKKIFSNSKDSFFEKIILSQTSDQLSLYRIKILMTGDFLCVMEKNVILENNALFLISKSINSDINFDLLYSDEEVIFEDKNKIQPFFKPDWSPYLFLQVNYVGNLFILSKKFLRQENFLDTIDLKNMGNILQHLCYKTNNISHLPEILFASLYNTSQDFNPFFNKENILLNLENKNIKSNVKKINNNKISKIDFELTNEPKVSIIIPTKNNHKLLSNCIRSLEYNTNYENFEIIIVDNNSNERTKSYLSSLPYNVILFEEEFNFSQMNNIALEESTGDYILFLNDDTESIEPNWLLEMVSICQQNDVGAVGAKLLYNNNTIQHAGMTHLKNGFFFHPLQKLPSKDDVQFDTLNLIRECSSVTGACLLTTRKILNDVKNYDETFDVYYGDSDLCFKIRTLGYSIIFTPHAILRHDGSSTIRKQSKIFIPTENFYDFVTKWPHVKNGDPYYNSNFSYDYDLDVTSASKSNLIRKKE
jgi:O-antigen biosynthesis protein